MAKRKSSKSKKRMESYESSFIKISKWDLPYSFGVNTLKDTWIGLYREYLDFEITGTYYIPKSLLVKV
jgi:hypothetical protein